MYQSLFLVAYIHFFISPSQQHHEVGTVLSANLWNGKLRQRKLRLIYTERK